MNLFERPENLATMPMTPSVEEGGPAQLEQLLSANRLSRDEYDKLRQLLQRAPTLAELGVFSSMWSEHCSYKSSKKHLRRLPTTGENVVVGPGENAGVVRIAGDLCAAFKMESHNHPSFIEPYQGAATGVGGILRDVFCMGARPIANLNCLRFGEQSLDRTHHLLEYAVKGIGDYGNCVGIPTVGGSLDFDRSYNGNCLVNAMAVGLIREGAIFKGYANGPGNLVVYVGSATGRDGIHGATMASDTFDSEEEGERAAVQVGDPFTEKLLMEATLEVLDKNLVVGLQDMGAAGLTSSSFEMAERAGTGLFMNLDLVPTRAGGMSAYELLLSESQERMLMVVEPRQWPAVRDVLRKWELAHDVIGTVTDSGRVEATHRGKKVLDVAVAPLTDAAPVYDRPCTTRTRDDQSDRLTEDCKNWITAQGWEKALDAVLSQSGDTKSVYQQYDHHIGNRTVLGPDAGGAAVLWLAEEAPAEKPHLGLALATGGHHRMCAADPQRGAQESVLKPARMIAAAGGVPLAVTDCLNFGNPEDPLVMDQLRLAVDGIGEACRQLATPVVSGNVSLYNETDGTSIAPTPMIGMVGRVHDVRHVTDAHVDQACDVYLLSPRELAPQFSSSSFAHLCQSVHGGSVPAVDWDYERQAMDTVRTWAQESTVLAIREVGDGGVLATLAKMNRQGRGMQVGKVPYDDQVIGCFGDLPGAYLIAVAPDHPLAVPSSQSLRLTKVATLEEAGATHQVSHVP